jgi:hypothetical protein
MTCPRLSQLVPGLLVAAAALLPALFGPPGFAASPQEAERAAAPPPPRPSLPEREVWWNQEWARILELGGGSWSVKTGQDLTVMEPADDSCRLLVLARGTGEVFEYAMQAEGRVTLGFGWIMVSPARPSLMSALETAETVEFPPYSGRESRQMLPQRVERLVWRGDAPWVVRKAQSYRYFVSTPTPADAGGNYVSFHSVTGEVVDMPEQSGKKFIFVQVAALPDLVRPRDLLILGGVVDYR